MNCADLRNQLASLIYGDLPADEAAGVEKHLAECSGCERERQALIQVKGLLDLPPASLPEIRLASLYRELAERQDRRAKLWRRAVIVLATAAAVLIAILGMSRLELQLSRGQVVIRWGSASRGSDSDADSPAPIQSPISSESQLLPRLVALEQRSRLLSELIHALADNVQALDRREQQDTARLDVRFQGMQQISSQRWSDFVQTVNSIRTALPKGEP
jgi:anti-sigma factor RsiW